MLKKRILAIPALVGVLALGGAGLAIAAGRAPTYKVCVKAGVVYGANANGACPAGTRVVLINSQGPAGLRGPAGARGANGATAAARSLPGGDPRLVGRCLLRRLLRLQLSRGHRL
jgi:hypothetical protein